MILKDKNSKSNSRYYCQKWKKEAVKIKKEYLYIHHMYIYV